MKRQLKECGDQKVEGKVEEREKSKATCALHCGPMPRVGYRAGRAGESNSESPKMQPQASIKGSPSSTTFTIVAGRKLL